MSAVAVVDIYNLALSHLGVSKEVRDPDENTPEANACRRFYDQIVGELLTDFAWPFAKQTVALALVETDPTTEWGYAYRYPSDCVTMRRILGTTRNETRQSRVPYLIGRDTNGTLIYTDWPDAVAEYTARVTDPTLFGDLLVQAMAAKLAYYIAPRVTSGDPYKLRTAAFQFSQQMIEAAKGNALNEEQIEEAPDSEFMRDRDSDNGLFTPTPLLNPFQ